MEDIQEEIYPIFVKEKNFIYSSFPFVDIQHVGGTSIPGSITKKELDIQIRIVPDGLNEIVQFFLENGYKPHNQEIWTDTFAIMSAEKNGIPVDYMITVREAKEDDHYKLRDFLKENKDALNKYNALKIAYAGKNYGDYRKAKLEFLIGHGRIPFLNQEEVNSNLEDEFNKLAKRWKADMEFFSLAYLAWSHEDYLKIIEMGKKMLPFILKDLEETKNYWFPALVKITGEDPVDMRDVGDKNRMTERWLEWAKIKNIQY